MFKLNDKGFAFTTMLYGLLVMGLLIVFLIMSLMQTNRFTNRKFVDEVEKEINRLGMTTVNFSVGANQEYIVPETGYYRVELWGSGKSSKPVSYISAYKRFTQGQKLYFTVENGGRESKVVLDSDTILSAMGYSSGSTYAYSSDTNSFYISPATLTSDAGKARITRLGENSPGSQYAAPTNGTYFIRYKDTENFLTKNSNDEVVLSKFTGNNNQRWKFIVEGSRIKIKCFDNINSEYILESAYGIPTEGIVMGVASDNPSLQNWESWVFSTVSGAGSGNYNMSLDNYYLTYKNNKLQFVNSPSADTAFQIIKVGN